MTDLSKPVQWIEGDRHHVGRAAIVRYSQAMTGHCIRYMLKRTDVSEIEVQYVLVRHSHTGELEYVEMWRLENYPASPIDSP